MSRADILAKFESLKSPPLAIQALWDGDSEGWHIWFSAIAYDGQVYYLGILSDSDIRLSNGQAPLWPEAMAAQQLGGELAKQHGAEFYFPSPNHPEDDCPQWSERALGYPCQRCGIPLLQHDTCPWRGLCFHCHLDQKREQREAKWTSEERAGPRCHICGNPATGELNGAPACANCIDKYKVYTCANCGTTTMLSKSMSHTELCSHCELQNAIDALTPAQRNTIRDAKAKGLIAGIKSAKEVMGCSLNDAQSVLYLLGNQQTPE